MTVTIKFQSAHRMIAVAMALLVAGCTNTSNDRSRTQAEGAAAGALLGAAAGAALASGGDRNKRLAGAAAGAAAGGLAGAAYGTSVANKKAGYIKTENRLDARLASIEQETLEYRTYNARLDAEVERRKLQLSGVLARRNESGSIFRQTRLRNMVLRRANWAGSEARKWQDAIDAHKRSLSTLEAGPQKEALEQGIEKLAGQHDELQRQREELITIGDKLQQ